MIVLAFDTALEACSAALWRDGEILAARSEPMARGHQERLAPLIEALAAEAGLPFSALDRVGVVVGPGSFTGLRVGLAFAKGLGLALDRPVVGVGTLHALAVGRPVTGVTGAVIDARRDQVYVQPFLDGRPAAEPAALALPDAAARLAAAGPVVRLTGTGAALLAPWFPDAEVEDRRGADPAAVARLAAEADPALNPPAPLYLRAPDAKLPA